DSEKEQNDFNGFVTVKKNDQWDPFIITLEQQEQWSYDENKVEISSDYVTNFVTKLSFNSSDQEEVKAFVYKMLPILSPESYLTEEEIEELFDYLKEQDDL